MSLSYQPRLSSASLAPAVAVQAFDEFGEARETQVAAERPLTLYVDRRELVTLMTLGSQPELLALGYLVNQGLISDPREVVAVQVDWDVEAAVITTRDGIGNLEHKLERRTVTTGCGQGTMFGDLMENIGQVRLPSVQIRQSLLYRLLRTLGAHNQVYRTAGAVHGCALCQQEEILMFVEDVGRHNAVDAIAGHMWLRSIPGGDKIFYTTGRLTSEMVIKVTQMGIPVLLSRSGVTQMGLDIARRVGVTLIARAKGSHFLVYNGFGQVVLDEPPKQPSRPTSGPSGDTKAQR